MGGGLRAVALIVAMLVVGTFLLPHGASTGAEAELPRLRARTVAPPAERSAPAAAAAPPLPYDGAPLPPLTELLDVDHGAWILTKKGLPRLLPGMTVDAFNDKLVAAIVRELGKAWPPHVISTFASSLLETAWAPAPAAKALAAPPPPKVAFCFLVGGEIATEPLWRSFFAAPGAAERYSVYVHPPRGFAFPRGSFFAGNAVAQDARYRVTWASLAMVHAELVLLAYALRDPLNQRFVLLSETDAPLWPFDCAYDFLFSSESSFLETRVTDSRFSMFDFDNRTGPVLSEWRKGSQWFALTRPHALILADGPRIRRWYRAFARKQLRRSKMNLKGDWGKITHVMNKPSFADEHFVQTTLAAAGNAEESVLPVSLTFATFGSRNMYTVWGDGRDRPFNWIARSGTPSSSGP